MDPRPDEAANPGESTRSRPTPSALLRGQAKGKHTGRCGLDNPKTLTPPLK